MRRAKLVPWTNEDCTDIETEQEEPKEEYFQAGRKDETLPNEQLLKKLSNEKKEIYRVFTDLEMVKEFLTDKKFIIVDDQADADIIFVKKHFKDFR